MASDELRAIAAAARFLTCLPVPGALATTDDLARALRYFPLVGLALGATLAGPDRVLSPWLAKPLLDFLLLAELVILSGALHFDGLIDSADGLFARGSAEQRLALMRESWAGPRGAAAGLALLLTQYAALEALEGPARTPALILAPLLGRWANVYGYVAFPYARSTPSVSREVKQGGTTKVLAGVTLFALVASCLLAWPTGPLLLGAAFVVGEASGRLARRRLGGLTGDVYGAIEQLVETLTLILAPLVLAR